MTKYEITFKVEAYDITFGEFYKLISEDSVFSRWFVYNSNWSYDEETNVVEFIVEADSTDLWDLKNSLDEFIDELIQDCGAVFWFDKPVEIVAEKRNETYSAPPHPDYK